MTAAPAHRCEITHVEAGSLRMAVTMNISEWRDVFDRMRVQDLKAMGPSERAVFAVAAATYRDALLRCRSVEASRLADEFDWLLEAAVVLQPTS